MRSLILRPRIELGFEALMPEEIGEKWVCFPAVGALYVRSYARKHGHVCDYLDAEALNLTEREAAERAARGGYDVIALPADTYSLMSTVRYARAVRQACPDAFLVCGGVHPTIYPAQTAQLDCFDAAIFGDGEAPFTDLLNALEKKRDPAGIPGVARHGKDEAIVGPTPPTEQNLDALGFPDYEGLPFDRYFSSVAKARPVAAMVTSRGCPFLCTFCDRPIIAGKLRLNSPAHVAGEIERLIGWGITEFSFYDDTFTARKKRALEILERIRHLPKKIGFDIRTRVDTLDESLLDALAASGCERVYLGIETGDDDMQKRIKKGIDLSRARWAVQGVQKRRMKAMCYFMLGLPGETRELADATVAYAASLRADYYLFEVFVPMPASEAYQQGIANGVLPGDYWAQFAANPTDAFHPPLWTEHLSKDELGLLIRGAYRRLYLDPAYLWRSLTRTATWEELKQKARGGMSFLKLLRA
ncbi:B12-binding domain-containing radical SAM protein [bacterium]|nr:B12-binding domain-containing radical SAM protein [bacterium]